VSGLGSIAQVHAGNGIASAVWEPYCDHRFGVAPECEGTRLDLRWADAIGRLSMQVKRIVLELLDQLPDNCSFDEVLYHLYVRRTVQAGLDDVDAGRVLTHDEVAESLRRRWQLGEGR
jgi:hypothetical protein